MTRALYYEDVTLDRFQARVLRVEPQGNDYRILLDQTAFYPEGGGQPADTGTLENLVVKDVQKKNGDIFHITEKPLETDAQVHGQIDYASRMDYSIQHSAQHLLSQCFLRVGNYPTVSVHFGEEYFTVEFKAREIPQRLIDAGEKMAHEIIAQNLPVKTYWIKPEEAKNYNIRRTPPKVERLRIVEISEFEFSTCGGTHVRSTGEIGILKIISAEKIRGNSRIKVLSGNRAYYDYQKKLQLTYKLSTLLTCGQEDIEARVAELLAMQKSQKREIIALQNELLSLKISQIKKNAPVFQGITVVTEQLENINSKSMNTFLQQILSDGNCLALLVNVAGGKLNWICSASDELKLPLMPLLNSALPLISGRGGGRGNRLQGGGSNVSGVNRFFEKFLKNVEEELNHE